MHALAERPRVVFEFDPVQEIIPLLYAPLTLLLPLDLVAEAVNAAGKFQ